MLLLVLVAGGEAYGFALLCGLLLGADELVVFLDAVDLVCLLFACGHVGFFLLGGVGVKYRYGCTWRATTHNEFFFFLFVRVGGVCSSPPQFSIF